MAYENLREQELSILIEERLNSLLGRKFTDQFPMASNYILNDPKNFWEDVRLYAMEIDQILLKRFYDECIAYKEVNKESLIRILKGLDQLKSDLHRL